MRADRDPSGLWTVLLFVRELFWSSRFAGMMGRILAAFSIISLIFYAFNFGMSEALKELLRYYDIALQLALGWLDPYLRWIADYLFTYINVRLDFSVYWRYIFVVLQILFVRDATVAFSDGRRMTALVRFAIGTMLSGIFSLLASIKLTFLSNFGQNLFFSLMPTLSIYVYDNLLYLYSAAFQIGYLNRIDGFASRTRREFLKGAIARGNGRFLLGVMVTLLSFALPVLRELPAPAGGLVAFAFATMANASYWLWRGARFAGSRSKLGDSWTDAFHRSEAGRFGMAVTSVFAWILVFVTLNTGLKLLGL